VRAAFLLVQLFVITGQYLIVTFGGAAFKTVPLRWEYWAATVCIGALSLPVGILLRLLPDFGLSEYMPKEERRPLVSQERMRWEAAIGEVQHQLRIYAILRRAPGTRRLNSAKLREATRQASAAYASRSGSRSTASSSS
jgi:hypothetical protein